MIRIKKLVVVVSFLTILCGCSSEDNTDYFETNYSETSADETSWFSEQVNKFSDWLTEKLDDFSTYEQAESLPESVYDYNVEENFPIMEEHTEAKKGIADYWDDMWRDKVAEED